jgi:hypothetical protein
MAANGVRPQALPRRCAVGGWSSEIASLIEIFRYFERHAGSFGSQDVYMLTDSTNPTLMRHIICSLFLICVKAASRWADTPPLPGGPIIARARARCEHEHHNINSSRSWLFHFAQMLYCSCTN